MGQLINRPPADTSISDARSVDMSSTVPETIPVQDNLSFPLPKSSELPHNSIPSFAARTNIAFDELGGLPTGLK